MDYFYEAVNIPQNTFHCVPQKKDCETGLKQHEAE